MAIITLTTDFGVKDYFMSALKGLIYKELADATIVDVSHHISPFNIPEAAYIIQNAYHHLPLGSVHIIAVDSEFSPENRPIVVKFEGHYFVCANNGIMSILCSEIRPEKIIEITIRDTISSNFSSNNIFVKTACHILRSGTLEVIGKKIDELKTTKSIAPFVNEGNTQIIGSVIYIDNYGNVITNIKRSFFDAVKKGRSFQVSARNYTFKTIHNTYNGIVNYNIPQHKRNYNGTGLVLFNASNHLEIAIYKSNPNTHGGAASLMGLRISDTVTVNFENL